jgi:hypothetical protein
MIYIATYALIGFLVSLIPLFFVDPTKDPFWRNSLSHLETELGISLDNWQGVVLAGGIVFFLLIILWPLVILDFVRSL